uniref:Uncharacterized protein n=1 Tax=Timema poppense TaxID=170557 RepID=A0A7R9DMR8_TIMPO|nr:unnamed protein product [Timema poppensis]
MYPHPVVRSDMYPHNVARSYMYPHTVTRSDMYPPPVARSDMYPHPVARSDMYPHTVSRSNMYPHTVTHSDMYPHTVARSDMYPHTVARSDMYPHTVARSDMYPHNVARSDMYPHPVARSDMYPHTVSRSDMYPHTVTHSDMYPHPVARSDMYPHTVARSDTYPHLVAPFGAMADGCNVDLLNIIESTQNGDIRFLATPPTSYSVVPQTDHSSLYSTLHLVCPSQLQNFRLLLAQKLTRDLGTSVHVIGPVDDLKLTGKDNKLVKQIVGFDGNSVFVLADAKKKGGEGNSELRKVLTHKPDPCLQYPQNTYGTTFVSQNFLEARASGRKQFLQVVSHRLADALSTELYEDCVCFLRDGVHAETRCRVSGRKERERLEVGQGLAMRYRDESIDNSWYLYRPSAWGTLELRRVQKLLL